MAWEDGTRADEEHGVHPQAPFNKHGSALQAAGKAIGSDFHRLSISFTDLHYTINVGRGKSRKDKVIIEHATGYIKPGTFVAIIGPTGSGKTSMLNILAGRVIASKATLTGQVLINGRPRDQSFKRVAAYVMQDDVLYSSLTVWESLMTAAMLRLPTAFPTEQKLQLAEYIIAELGLTKARDTKVGNALVRGISGGERKRVNIAIEMLSNPSIIFLDEPTSGLDSFQALNVMGTMSDIAKSGRTVISTIHQPRSSIFAMFETLMLLTEGKVVYFGPATSAVHHFASNGCICPSHFNPADFFMDTISMDRRDEAREAASSARIARLAATYEPAPEVRADPSVLAKEAEQESIIHYSSRFASSYLCQLRALSRRSWWQTSRDKIPLIILCVQVGVTTILTILLWGRVKEGQTSIQDRQGFIFFITVFFAFNGVFQMITTFPLERSIMARERASNAYRISAFYPAKIIAEGPLRIMPILMYVVLTYWAVHLQRSASKFFIFLGISALEYLTMQAAGLMVSSAAPSPQAALALGPLTTVLFMVFGGFFVNPNTMPVWIRWFRYLSPIQYGFVALSINEFKGRTFTCKTSDTRCLRTGDEVLDNLSLHGKTIGGAVGLLTVVLVVFHAMAYVFLLNNGPRIQPISQIKASRGAKSAAPVKEDAAITAGEPVHEAV